MAVLNCSDKLTEIFPALLLGKDGCNFSLGHYPLLEGPILNKLCDEVQFIMGRVINGFIEFHYIWVVKLFKNCYLCLYGRISMLVFAYENLFELGLVHDLHCEIVLGVLVDTLNDFREFPTSNLFHNDILVNDLFASYFFGDGRDGGDASRTFQVLRATITYRRERSSTISLIFF